MSRAAITSWGSRATGTPLLVATLWLLGAGLAVELAVGATNPFLPLILLTSTFDAVLGAAVGRRRPDHPVAWVLQTAALAGAFVVVTGAHVDAALAESIPDTGMAWTLWLNRWLWVLLVATPTALLFAFPDGRLPSPRWRPAAWLVLALVALMLVQAMAAPFTDSFWQDAPVRNPLGPAAEELSSALGGWPAAGLVAASAIGAAAVVARRRSAVGDLRERLRWVAPAALLLPPALGVSLLGPWEWAGLLEMAAAVLLTVAVFMATFRHRMYDVDVVVDRAVVYGLLVVSLVGAYVGVVVLTGSVVGEVSWLPGVLGAAVVAVVFGPLLHLLRQGADELLFGVRRAPEQVASRLLDLSREHPDADGHADDDPLRDLLTRAASTLRTSLRLPWVRLECGDIVVCSGEPRTEGVPVPLTRGGGRQVGLLVVGRRYDDERVRPEDPTLAPAVAQLSLTLDALLTADELRAARDRLSVARTEERRRIHRDLHDGLGPTLAGVCLGLESAEELGTRDPSAAAATLGPLSSYARQAVEDVRHLVDGLRPEALDTLGLAGTLRERLTPLGAGAELDLRLEIPSVLPEMGEEVELAALRICLEAVTNVIRHAGATTCEVTVTADSDRLVLQVSDDGRGVGDTRPHVGLVSMRERALGVGGTFDVTGRSGGGTVVLAVLPLTPSTWPSGGVGTRTVS